MIILLFAFAGWPPSVLDFMLCVIQMKIEIKSRELQYLASKKSSNKIGRQRRGKRFVVPAVVPYREIRRICHLMQTSKCLQLEEISCHFRTSHFSLESGTNWPNSFFPCRTPFGTYNVRSTNKRRGTAL